MGGAKFFFFGIIIGIGQVVFFDYLEEFGYWAFAPTVVALAMIWWGIHLMGKQNMHRYAYQG